MRKIVALAIATFCAASGLSFAHAQTDEGPSILETLRSYTSIVIPGGLLEPASQYTPPRGEYDRRLFDGYIALSRAEYSEGDYTDSDVFARRAMQAAKGATIEPEHILSRDLPTQMLNIAAQKRQKLVSAQARGARTFVFDWAADAQLAFDCWLQEQEENWQEDDIAACLNRFDIAMSEVSLIIEPKDRPAPDIEIGRLSTEVFFDLDSDKLGSEALEIIDQFASWVAVYDDPIIALIGNADQSGDALKDAVTGEDYNAALSKRRAEAVALYLATKGVRPDTMVARGDEVPAVFTYDRSPERANRRVVLIVRER